MKLDSLYLYLPERLSKALIALDITDITEIRLRESGAVSVTCANGNIVFDEKGNITSVEKGIHLTAKEISECVEALCKHSKYSFEEYIKNGFIPLDSGARAGVCGKALTSKGSITTFSEITSVNIRLNSFFPELAKDSALLMKNSPCGIAIYSPPGMGKTTYLKSLIYLLSTGKYTPPYRVGVVDERFELGEATLKKGLCDIISGTPKRFGIELLTRTMSPEIIVCDEILPSDESSILSGCNAGVSFICSFHGRSIEEISKRGYVMNILNSGIFQYSVCIQKSKSEYKYIISNL